MQFDCTLTAAAAGGAAGMMEALACHPLGQSLYSLPLYTKLIYPDTIKVRMQLSRRKRAPGVRLFPSQKSFSILTGQ